MSMHAYIKYYLQDHLVNNEFIMGVNYGKSLIDIRNRIGQYDYKMCVFACMCVRVTWMIFQCFLYSFPNLY